MLAMTVWKQDRFDFIRKLQNQPPISPETDRYNYILQTSLSRDCELEEELYRKTGVVYSPYSSDTEITYGEAFISPAFLASQWDALYEHISTADYGAGQEIVFLKKRSDACKSNRETLQEMARIAKMYDIQSICVSKYNKKVMTERRNNGRDDLLEKEALLRRTETQLSEKTRHVEELLDSASWRVTAPLRRAYDILLRLKGK